MDAHNNLVLMNWMHSLTLLNWYWYLLTPLNSTCNQPWQVPCYHNWLKILAQHLNHQETTHHATNSGHADPTAPVVNASNFSRPDQWLWTRHIFPRSLFLMTSWTSLFLWTATFNSVTPLSAQPTDTYRLSPPLTKTHFQVIKLDLPSVFSESIYLIYICHEQVIDLFYSLVWRVSALSLTPERLVLP